MSNFPTHAVDWVIIFRESLPGVDPAQAISAWNNLTARLQAVGLVFKTRKLDADRLSIWIHCPDELLTREWHKECVNDWLNDVGLPRDSPIASLPDDQKPSSRLVLSPAQRLRLIHDLLVQPYAEGGVGLLVDMPIAPTPAGERTESVGGKYVEALLTPHDKDFDKRWIKTWSQKWILSRSDLDSIKDVFGENVALYFSFLQFYFFSLVLPAVVGVIAWLANDAYSPVLAIVMSIWSVLTIELWKRHASYLSVRWATRNASKTLRSRPGFKAEAVLVDEATGEKMRYYSPVQRWRTICSVTFPALVGSILALSVIIFAVVSLEIFFNEYYNGPFKMVLGLLPTVVYCAALPLVTAEYNKIARKLTELENRPTVSDHQNSLSEKIFLSSFLLIFLSLLIISFVFIPAADVLGHYLIQLGFIGHFNSSAALAPTVLQLRVFFFFATGQVVNNAVEVLLPMAMDKVNKAIERRKDKQVVGNMDAEEIELIEQIRTELAKPEHDVFAEYSEMCLQFGMLAVFSVVWPLGPLMCLINNWVELRSDALKICQATRRPIPVRAENMGPWLNNMQLLAWLGSVVSPALVFLYRNWDVDAVASTQSLARLPQVILAVFIWEHGYFLCQHVVRLILASFVPEGDIIIRRAQYVAKHAILSNAGITASISDSQILSEAAAIKEASLDRISGTVHEAVSANQE
ncbi:calcium-activated chloride channel-domain-containing protein [Polychytrium aggregatum]|uniref:calcium-activated chloride channel-domain-containing protein n=1 Tax=Polychytrium aggregatum TaxID=110093 RepID=UPI0022FEB042|nr:calcium-activated chloride channel-domain-containing protein [Polychytrium aggregatum]KAI9207144.1 calcium-activated chloride channel-domain-containing protein [Polychytrium aggregatum]